MGEPTRIRAGVATAATALIAMALAGCGIGGIPNSGAAPNSGSAAPTSTDPDLIWRDDFSGAAGSGAAASRWTYAAGRGASGSGELQTYTTKPANSALNGSGDLVVRALASTTNTFTSARLVSRARPQFTTGTVQARIRMPTEAGVLATFALISVTPAGGLDPTAGEIDIAQMGADPLKIFATLRGPETANAAKQWQVGTSFPQTLAASEGFHTYALQKSPRQIVFALDGHVTAVVKAADLPTGDRWVFDGPFAVVLDLSVGGVLAGRPLSTTVFPALMTVDWVSVSRRVTA